MQKGEETHSERLDSRLGSESGDQVEAHVPDKAKHQEAEPAAVAGALEIQGATFQYEEQTCDENHATNPIEVEVGQPDTVEVQGVARHGRHDSLSTMPAASPLPALATALTSRVLVLDGAMGTELHERGIPFQQGFEQANLDHPDRVLAVHRAYREAGAEILLTNTFGGNRYRLGRHQLAEKQVQILESGANLAREAAEGQAWVLGSLGPLGVEMEPLGRLSTEEVRAAFREAAAILGPQVDGFCLETFNHAAELEQALHGIREACPDHPVVALVAVRDRMVTLHGDTPQDAARLAMAAGADAFGFNCSSGPRVVLEAVQRVLDVCDLPLVAKPNAGMPRQFEGRVLYEKDTDYFARFARRFLQAGGQMVGGCCGTTPEHVRALASAARLGKAQAATKAREQAKVVTLPPKEALEPVPLAERSVFAAALASGRCPISVELIPPRTPDMSKLIAAAQQLRRAGVDAINLPDGPRASARISNMAAATILARETGIEPLIHFCCRDRNLLGMQSDLLGAAALGLHNLLVITGDPPYQGDYPDLTAVFDVDAIGLCNIVDNLNRGLDLGGHRFDAQTSFCYGAAFNQDALDPAREAERYRWKVEAGVEYLMTQPVFDAEVLLQRMKEVRALHPRKPPLLAGIWPLRSLRNAEFLHAEVPGVRIPDEVLERMRRADEQARAAEEGLAIALETVDQLKGKVDGFQLAAPFNRIEASLQLVARIRATS